MRILAIICSLFFVAATCKTPAEKAFGKKKAAQILWEYAKFDTLTWKLVSIYDPYQKGTYYQTDSLNPQYLSFTRKGKFVEYDTAQYRKGRWAINQDSAGLRLSYTEIDGDEIPKDDQDTKFRFLLNEMSLDTLVLGLQGRHGIVKRTYLRMKPIEPLMIKDTTVQPGEDNRSPAPQTLELAEAVKIMLPDTIQDTIAWSLQYIKDPYTQMLPESQRPAPMKQSPYAGNPHYLLFCRNGDFVEKDTMNYAKGTWDLNLSGERLRLNYEQRNGREILNEQNPLFRWEIQRINADSMILGIQGRHGIVQHIYQKVQDD